MLVETTHLISPKLKSLLYFARRRKDVHLCFIMSPDYNDSNSTANSCSLLHCSSLCSWLLL